MENLSIKIAFIIVLNLRQKLSNCGLTKEQGNFIEYEDFPEYQQPEKVNPRIMRAINPRVWGEFAILFDTLEDD